MIGNKLKEILSLNGISLIIGIIGGISTFTTILITDLNAQISVKWLLFTIFVFIFCMLIAFKLCYELFIEARKKTPLHSKAIRYLANNNLLLVETNQNLEYSVKATIFYLTNGVELVMGNGYVSNIQENFVHISILEIDAQFAIHYSDAIDLLGRNDVNTLQNIIVKSITLHSN